MACDAGGRGFEPRRSRHDFNDLAFRVRFCDTFGLMELEVEGLTGATYGEKSQDRLVQRNATATRSGRPAPAAPNCASPSCAKARIFPVFLNRDAQPGSLGCAQGSTTK
jgi:hypothetical protein